MPEQPRFLLIKYPGLAGSKPVIRAVEQAKRTSKETPHTKDERINAYLNRLDTILSRPMGFDKERGDRGGFDLLKHKLFEKYVTKPEDIPESYWRLQTQIIRERGQAGDWERANDEEKAEVKRQTAEGVLADQRASLEQWIDYLASSDVQISPDIRYWTFRNVLNLQEYDKEKKEFPKRSRGTVKQFPDINYEALAYVVDALGKKFKGTPLEFEYDIQPNERVAFQQALDKEDFAKLYGWANELYNPIPEHLLPVTEGEWRVFYQGSDSNHLVQTVRGKGTGWCTAGEQTANRQLEAGDFHVFYSLDDEQKPTIPRIAIRQEGAKIVEVRGVAYKQNLDSYMLPVLEAKLHEFPDGDQYLKKDADMQRLTFIEAKVKQSESLSKEDLTFLYELDAPIEGFGYDRDPRIAELLGTRNTKEDAPIVLDCAPEDIAHSASEISEHTKTYIGPLFAGIFDSGIEHILTSFPEGNIKRYSVEIGGASKEQLRAELEKKDITVTSYAEDLFKSKDFTTSSTPESAELVRLTVEGLGFPQGATTDEIYAKAAQLGLDLCPAEVGPQLRLSYTGNDWIHIAMKQIAGRDGDPCVFNLLGDGGGLELHAGRAGPDVGWGGSDSRFVFRLRK